MFCRSCGAKIGEGDYYCTHCGMKSSQGPILVGDQLIADCMPKNTPAVTSYYLGIFSLAFPPLGFLAIKYGIDGLRRVDQDPKEKGKNHAWLGIVVGGIGVLEFLFIVGVIIVVGARR